MSVGSRPELELEICAYPEMAMILGKGGGLTGGASVLKWPEAPVIFEMVFHDCGQEPCFRLQMRV